MDYSFLEKLEGFYDFLVKGFQNYFDSFGLNLQPVYVGLEGNCIELEQKKNFFDSTYLYSKRGKGGKQKGKRKKNTKKGKNKK